MEGPSVATQRNYTWGSDRLMISDRKISATIVIAALLWTIGGALIILGALTYHDLTGVGLWLSGVGAVFSVRRMFCRQAQREVTAFDLGRELERESLRSV